MTRLRQGVRRGASGAGASSPRRFIKYPWLLAIGVWGVLLLGFVSPLTLVVLSLSGPLAIRAGARLAMTMGRKSPASGWSVAGVGAGVALVGAGFATLVPGAPDRMLTSTPVGWDLLNRRTARLNAAVSRNDVSLAHRLLQRGVGDTVPVDTSGRPLIHHIERPEMLAEFLEHGLDPDALNDDEETPLMLVRQPELARLLLAAGADVHARDRLGRTVADHHVPYGPVHPVLLAHAGGALRDDSNATLDARTDWLRREPDATARASSASITPAAPGRGDEATLALDLRNASDADRRLRVSAELNEGLLFVSASAGGAIVRPRRPQSLQRVQWPVLLLPAGGEGRLDVRVVRRADGEAPDPVARFEVSQEPGGNVERFEIAPVRGERQVVEAETRWPRWTWLAFLVPLGLLAGAGIRRLRHPDVGGGFAVGRVAAMAGATVTVGIAVALSWSAVEPFARFASATCTILDRRVYDREIRSTSRTSTSTRTYAVPVAAVRIDTGGAARVATGFTTGWATYNSEELRPFALGARVPCWVDPSAPTRFTLVRRPPLSLAVGLGMLTLITLAFAAIARLLGSSPAQPPRRKRSTRPPRDPQQPVVP